MKKRVSFKQLVSNNKLEITKDQQSLDEIEKKIEKKHSMK